MESQSRFSTPGPSRNHVELGDRLRSGVLLGCALWGLDSGLNILADYFAKGSQAGQADLLIAIFFAALVVPFFLTQRIFRTEVWTLGAHTLGDRIWTVLFASIFQLGAEFIGLQRISDGKLVMSLLYAVITSLAAVSEFRSRTIRAEDLDLAENEAALKEELRQIRRRSSWISFGAFLFFSFIKVLAVLPNILGLNAHIYLLLISMSLVLGIYMFNSAHSRCPRCGKRLPKGALAGCKSCGL